MVRGMKINGEVLERKIAEAYMSKALFARTIGVSRPTVTSWI
jgi:DNA-binding transcriptional regulator YiaG